MKKKILICIVGGSGSGKSTLEDKIIIQDGFRKAISTTTRDKRDGEHNGREYHFVSIADFEKLIKDNKLVEYVKFANNYYGLTVDEFYKNDDHLVFVVEPNGLNQITKYIKENNLDIVPIVIYMDITEKERFKNMVKRGDNPISIQERLKTETIIEDFEKIEIEPDIKITKLTSTTSQFIKDLQRKLLSL